MLGKGAVTPGMFEASATQGHHEMLIGEPFEKMLPELLLHAASDGNAKHYPLRCLHVSDWCEDS